MSAESYVVYSFEYQCVRERVNQKSRLIQHEHPTEEGVHERAPKIPRTKSSNGKRQREAEDERDRYVVPVPSSCVPWDSACKHANAVLISPERHGCHFLFELYGQPETIINCHYITALPKEYAIHCPAYGGLWTSSVCHNC